MTRTFLLCIGLLLAPAAALCHEGHDHGPRPARPAAVAAVAAADPAAAALADGPRLALQTPRFEAVGVLAGRTVWLWVDRWADNQPVDGARLRLDLGAQSVDALPVGAAYRVELPSTPPAGDLPVVLRLQLPAADGAPAEDDLLTGRLAVPPVEVQDAAPGGTARTAVLAAGAAAALLAALCAGWWLGRRNALGRTA